MTSSLNYKLFVTEQIPQSGRDPLPDGTTRMWSPITSTLILGTREAVLVDPPLTTRRRPTSATGSSHPGAGCARSTSPTATATTGSAPSRC